MNNRVILVASAGRSGTSAVGGVLHTFGVPMGKGVFSYSKITNQKGFFSDLDLRGLNTYCLGGDNYNPRPPYLVEWRFGLSSDNYTRWINARSSRSVDGVWGANDPQLVFTGRKLIEKLHLSGTSDIRVIQTERNLEDSVKSLVRMGKGRFTYTEAKVLQMEYLLAQDRLARQCVEWNVPVTTVKFAELTSESEGVRMSLLNRLYDYVWGGIKAADDKREQRIKEAGTRFLDPGMVTYRN